MVIAQEDTPNSQEAVRDEKGRFTKGHSGNYAGYPGDAKSISGHIRALLAESDGDKTLAERIARKLIELTLAGDRQAMDMVLDRMEGRPIQSLMHGSITESTQSLLEGLTANRNGGENAVSEPGQEETSGEGQATATP